MESKNQTVSLDKEQVVSLLEDLLVLVESKSKDGQSIINLSNKLDLIYNTNHIDKERLISKWIQISGEDAFKRLQVTNIEEYFKVLPAIFKSASMYLNKTGDYLYLLAELSIATDWYQYQSINLGTD